MMKMYIEATIVAVSKESFKDNAGDVVEYFVNFVKNTDGQTIQANSKADFTSCEGKTGVAGIETSLGYEGKNLKYSLREFLVDSTLGLPEEVIA